MYYLCESVRLCYLVVAYVLKELVGYCDSSEFILELRYSAEE